jgi:outer membrane immunogenic protein
MKYLFGSAIAVAALGFSAAASAADMPVYLKAPPAAPAWDWTGMYLGYNVGYGWGKKDLYDIYPTPDGSSDGNPTLHGALGGLQGGYRKQFNWAVIGIQADYSWSGVGSHFNCFLFGDQVCDAKTQWFASLTGSLGVLVTPQALLYVKGGGAAVRDQFSDMATTTASLGGIPSNPGVIFSADQTRLGWTLGAGFEYAITHNWSIFAEYDYMNFGSQTVSYAGENGSYFPELITQEMQMVKIGMNYKLDWTQSVSALGYANTPSSSGSSYPKALTKASSSDDQTYHELLFAGTDFTSRNSVDAWMGGLIAPTTDLDTPGPRIYVSADGGFYKYIPQRNTPSITGAYETGDLLGGWGLEGNNYSVNLLGGISAENQHESRVDPNDPDHGTQVGPKIHMDAWINPTAQTLIYDEAEYSTAFNTYYVSGKFGFDPFGKEVFIGPEVVAMGDDRYDQGRVGVHITQMTLGKVHIGIAGGYEHDTSTGSGGYGTLELDTNF